MNELYCNDLQLATLNNRIEEIRVVLNDICNSSDGSDNELRLAVSQYLDELIVEYQKKMLCKI